MNLYMNSKTPFLKHDFYAHENLGKPRVPLFNKLSDDP